MASVNEPGDKLNLDLSNLSLVISSLPSNSYIDNRTVCTNIYYWFSFFSYSLDWHKASCDKSLPTLSCDRNYNLVIYSGVIDIGFLLGWHNSYFPFISLFILA